MRFLLSGFIERVRHDLMSLSHPAFAVARTLPALANIRSQIATGFKTHVVMPSRLKRRVKRALAVMDLACGRHHILMGGHGRVKVGSLLCLRSFVCWSAPFAVISLLWLVWTLYLSGLVMMTAIGAGAVFGIDSD